MASFNRTNEDARLKELILQGFSFGVIAEMLAAEGFPPRSRSAHAGRANRQKLVPAAGHGRRVPVTQFSTANRPKVGRAKPAPSRQSLAFNGRAASSAAPVAAVVVVKPAAPPPPLPFDRPGVPYRTAKRSQCAYPLWGDGMVPIDARRVCGEPAIPGHSYCPACYGVAYRPLPRIDLARNARKLSMHDGVRVAAPRDETPGLCAEMA